ncbi:MAG: alpha/beta fold hydrolase [Parcubacteria group bacterium]|jgi:carboxylesterase
MVKRLLKSVKSILFADPNLLYAEERSLINQPFYFKGTNGKGVLLLHGWTSTAYEVRRLGKYLNENGYTVYGPMLKGHGMKPEDLEGVKWADWLDDVKAAHQELKKNCEEVFIGGTSIGANLAVHFSVGSNDVAGLVLMAMPYKIKYETASVAVAKIMKLFGKYHRKFYPPTFGLSTTITRLISYQKYPIDSALETFDLIKKTRETLPTIIQPCLMIQSTHDHIATKDNLECMYADVRSERKQKKYVKQAYHTFISDIKNEHVFEDILKFINSL